MKYFICKAIVSVFLPLVLLAQTENWVYRYNGTGGFYDCANSLVYGADGNIYAAGYSCGIIEDFMVISLTTSGDTNWTYRYNGPANYYDYARSIVYGADGNIYIAGTSTSTGTDRDFTIISLTPTGEANWIYEYNEPGNYDDYANSIIYGTDNNIYATGMISNDFAVISLTTSGDTNWTYRYGGGAGALCDEGYSIVYGADGNIYAAGYRSAFFDTSYTYEFTVISLTTAGNINWLYAYHGPDTVGIGKAYSLVYGADGNIYAAGFSAGANGPYDDFTVISLTTMGDSNWIFQYDGSANLWDAARSISYGSDGNIYAAGYCCNSGTAHDFTVASLTTAGVANWIYQYDGGANHWDSATSVVYGADGNIYAAGSSYGSHITWHDFTVISFSISGDTNWVYKYNGPGSGNDFARSIVYGLDGNIYAGGYSEESYRDFTVISLPPDLGIQEEKSIVKKDFSYTTVISGPLLLPADRKCKVFDITGRVVLPNKIKPGIYFIEVDGKITRKVIKIK